MNADLTPEPAQQPQFKQPEHIVAGLYPTAVIVSNTREEFFLDFLATFTAPLRLVSRIIISPPHAKRLVTALRNNLQLYRTNFPEMPDIPDQKPPDAMPMQDIYTQITLPDAILAGSYANNVLLRHTREEFVLDFLVVAHPTPVLVARILVNPAHMKRVMNVLDERVKAYENAFGPLEEPPPSPEPPSPLPRFSLS